MKVGVPKEIKPQENRIGLTPESVKNLVSDGHEVLVETNGGYEAGFENKQYFQGILTICQIPFSNSPFFKVFKISLLIGGPKLLSLAYTKVLSVRAKEGAEQKYGFSGNSSSNKYLNT